MKFISNNWMNPLKRRKNRMPRNITQKKKKETPFQLFFLKNDETQNVEVIELNEINFEEVKSRLEKGESILITRKQMQNSEMNFIAYDTAKEPWYRLRN
jgi:hypothetical protein